MSQPVYPSTLPNPDAESFTRGPAIDPTLRTDLEDGGELVMNTKTRVPLFWSFSYRFLTSAERDTLMNFYAGDANYGAVVVKYTDPTDSTAYFVRFAAKLMPVLERSQKGEWRIDVQLRQAPGSYT
jgi:hypothetical protein